MQRFYISNLPRTIRYGNVDFSILRIVFKVCCHEQIRAKTHLKSCIRCSVTGKIVLTNFSLGKVMTFGILLSV